MEKVEFVLWRNSITGWMDGGSKQVGEKTAETLMSLSKPHLVREW